MTDYHSSDWHLGHARIIEFCDRPFASTITMNRTIIERCNDIVTERDRLILHGDNALGTYADNIQLLTKLRAGRIILLPGNHDRFSLAARGSDDKRRKAAEYIKSLFADAPHRIRVLVDKKPSSWGHQIAGHKVLLSHYPYRGDSQENDRHLDMRPEDEGLPLIHGHVHTKWRENGRQLNVGVDVWDFAPVSEHAIFTWIETSSSIVVGSSSE